MDDLEFAQRCVEGDKSAWIQFIEKYSRLIFRYINSVLAQNSGQPHQNEANDISQEILVMLSRDNFRKLSTFKAKNGCSLASWLRHVTVNYTYDYLRRLKPAASLDEQNDDGLSLGNLVIDSADSAADKLKNSESAESLQECIEKLNTDDKFFVEFHFYRGVGLEEMRGFLRLSRGAVDMRKSRLLERLKDCFKSKGLLGLQ